MRTARASVLLLLGWMACGWVCCAAALADDQQRAAEEAKAVDQERAAEAARARDAALKLVQQAQQAEEARRAVLQERLRARGEKFKAPVAGIKKVVQLEQVGPAEAPGTATPESGSAPPDAPATGAAASAVPRAPVDPDVLRIELMEGSGISGKLSVKELSVATRYGTLKVPVTRIVSFTPGLDSYPQLHAKLAALVEQLGSDDYNAREQAHKELAKMGLPIRGELQQHTASDNAERARHVKQILVELDEMAQNEYEEGESAPPATWIREDTVTTPDFTVVGKISPRDFEVQSKFGNLTIQLGDIRRGYRETQTRDEIRKNVSVEGQNLVQRSFKSSTVRVDRGDRVTVTASGTITMTPWGGETASTPDGGENFGWFIPGQIPGGALVAKIGDSGKVFKVGTKQTFVADRAGTLQFAVAMQHQYARHHYQFPGKYDVKIRVEPK